MDNTFRSDERPDRFPGLTKVIQTVARQKHKAFGRRYFVTKGDMEHDLFIRAYSDVSFIADLAAIGNGEEGTRLAFRFVDKAAKCQCRKYRAKWPRLGQRIPESPADS
jgi:hypothetical protein